VGARVARVLNREAFEARLRTQGIEPRPALRTDVCFAFDALRAAMRTYVEATWGAWDDAHQHALFAPSFDLRTHRILVVAAVDAGVLAVDAHPLGVTLLRLYLLPAFQRRGVGGTVVGALVEAAHAGGLPVDLTVLRANDPARRLYERLGFRTVGETPTHLHMEAAPASEAAR
jgi:ribosomal protein S18 acetylase RimI-like enzyme